MTQEIWTMSARELDRLAILERVESAGLRQGQAAAEMGVSERREKGAAPTECPGEIPADEAVIAAGRGRPTRKKRRPAKKRNRLPA
ncbi:MAG: hypothetical protein OXU54_01185 [Gammaproteobacteria bacterium]|nr:hypothetical protein [Gammaproteobacteria bacterium]